MNSATSTKPGQVFVLLSMAAATVAVMVTQQTHPAALIMMSVGVLACGAAGYFFHMAMASLAGAHKRELPASNDRREMLAGEKARVMHSIKELEFDSRVGKIDMKDFEMLSAPLRQRAMELMEELDRIEAEPESVAVVAAAAGTCPSCATSNDADARFCKSCGAKL